MHLIADKHKLGQVMRNLVSNGIKFTGASGKIAVKLSMVSVTSKAVTAPTERKSRWWFLSLICWPNFNPAGLAKKDVYGAGQDNKLAIGEDGAELLLRIEVTDSGAGISKVCVDLTVHCIFQTDSRYLNCRRIKSDCSRKLCNLIQTSSRKEEALV